MKSVKRKECKRKIDIIKGLIKAQEEKIAKYEQEYQKALENFRNAKESTVVCTKFDVESIKFKLFADIIEETLDFEVLSETDFPADAFSKFSTSKEYTSAIEYVKMVVRYWIENKPFELLYYDDGIKHILNKMKLF